MGVTYTPISVEGFRPVATFSRGWKPKLNLANNLKPETEIGVYRT